jgi:hypothetical protein
MHEAVIKLQDVSLGYDGRAVLEHVTGASSHTSAPDGSE